MADSSGSLGPFLEGYREGIQKMRIQKKRYIPQSIDILDLFAETGRKSMTTFEISSKLMLSSFDLKGLIDELVDKRLVAIKQSRSGDFLVELTKKGELFIQA